MDKKLPARPNLEHLRSQAKALLSDLNAADPAAIDLLIAHLPAARGMTPDQVRAAGFRLADAQSAIARKTGFGGWPSLARHVEQLRSFEGTWEFLSLEIDGSDLPTGATADSQILMDGDRFRMESPEAEYEGIFSIDVEPEPHHIDIEFVAGPEAGNTSHGIYELKGDGLTICLSLSGATRPEEFRTTPGSGYALEMLHRASGSRPAGVEGGEAPPASETESIDESAFEVEMTPILERLQGDWVPVELAFNGRALPDSMLSMGSRQATGNETKVVFGGQTMVHAKVRIDETQNPIAVDYLNLGGKKRTVTLGIMEWAGEEVRFCMASPGAGRPADFSCEPGSGRTLSRWRRQI